jgi:hypothetical protein
VIEIVKLRRGFSTTCSRCGCEFRYQLEDLHMNRCGSFEVVTCPGPGCTLDIAHADQSKSYEIAAPAEDPATIARSDGSVAVDPRHPRWRGQSGGNVVAPGPDLSSQQMLDEAARALGWRTDFACGDSPITWKIVLDEIRRRPAR